MSETAIPHGTASGYSHHGCRCDDCKAYKRQVDRARYERRVGRPVRVAMTPEEVAVKNRARVRAWQKANPERTKETQLAYRQRNREKIRKAQLARYYRLMAENPEQIRQARRDWQKTPSGRAFKRANETRRRRGVPYSDEAIAWMASLKDPACHFCGGPATEIDHLTPISRGGTGDLSNLAPACRSCNASKGAKTESEFREKEQACA